MVGRGSVYVLMDLLLCSDLSGVGLAHAATVHSACSMRMGTLISIYWSRAKYSKDRAGWKKMGLDAFEKFVFLRRIC